MLWRHGRTEWNAARRFQGHSDIPLDSIGIAQAKLAAPILAQLRPTKIVSSDLVRAHTTAQSLAELTNLPIEIDPDLRETYAADWEGLLRHELEERFGDELAAWAAGSDLAPGGTGERRSQVAERMTAAIERALADVPSEGVLVVVTHGGSARAAIGSMLGLPTDHWGILGVLTNCAWCVLGELSTNPTAGASLADLVTVPTDKFPDVPVAPRWRLVEYNARTLPDEPTADDR